VIVAGVEEASIAIEEGRLAALKCARSLKRVSAELVDENLATVQNVWTHCVSGRCKCKINSREFNNFDIIDPG